MAYSLSNRLANLPLELFEELVEATEPREYGHIEDDPYEIEDLSHYRQCRINEQINLPIPPIEEFYKNHNGYAKFSALK